MKINYTLPNLKISGGIKVKLEHCTRLAERGHEVTLTITKKRSIKLGWFPLDKRVKILSMFPSDLGKKLPNADVLIMNHFPYALEIPVSKGRLFIPRQIEEDLTEKDLRILSKLKSPYLWLPNSAAVEKILYRQGFKNTHVVQNGINHEWFNMKDRVDNNNILTHLNVKKRRKGAPETIEILLQVHKMYPNIQITAFGQVRKSKIASCPKWMRWIEPTPQALIKLYKQHGIYFYGALLDGFANSVAEAMASGCTVVTALNAGTIAFAKHAKTALTYTPTNLKEGVALLVRAIEDSSLRKELSKAGIEESKNYDWEKSVDSLEKAFDLI